MFPRGYGDRMQSNILRDYLSNPEEREKNMIKIANRLRILNIQHTITNHSIIKPSNINNIAHTISITNFEKHARLEFVLIR